ncbi:MAG: SIS domain-containing protein [Desulfobacterales bacterium]|jgi:6-phospho-3-hexuloisomerase
MSTSYKNGKTFAIRERIDAVLEENRPLVQRLSDKAAQNFLQKILDAKSIFFSAQGRAGFILRCFCMRLMHLGFSVYFCGETITPAITPDDLLIVLSGSGETPSTLESVRSAKKYHAKTCGILGNMESRIASMVDMSLHIPGTTKLCREGEPHSLQMAGSLFEQTAFLFLEAIVLDIYQKRKKDVGSVSSRHTVIE